jgi:hypothetical protein
VVIARRLGRLAAGERRRDRHVALRAAARQRIERAAGIIRPAQPELGETGVIGRILCEWRLGQ